AGWAARRRYGRDRKLFASSAGTGFRPPAPTASTSSAAEADYAFEAAPTGLRVSFPCPTCHQRIRLPCRGRLRARCTLCFTTLECDT
ncbi:MAG: hypothetical protein QOF98_503, partial [Streptomyces sp.]|nr:hypothetical protein [Streptomyces sp.]